MWSQALVKKKESGKLTNYDTWFSFRFESWFIYYFHHFPYYFSLIDPWSKIELFDSSGFFWRPFSLEPSPGFNGDEKEFQQRCGVLVSCVLFIILLGTKKISHPPKWPLWVKMILNKNPFGRIWCSPSGGLASPMSCRCSSWEVLSDGNEKVKPKLLQLQELLESMCMLACLVRFLPHHGCFCS